MQSHFQNFFPNMDRYHWFRMLVCFLPGLAIGKLAANFPHPFLQIASSILLVAGVGTYLAWGRIRHRFLEVGRDAEATTENAAVSPVSGEGRFEAQVLAHLVTLCNGSHEVAQRLVATEIALSPELTYGQAIVRARDRRQLESDQ